MLAQKNLVELWYDEYVQKGIPSSFKEEPSGPLIELVSFLKNNICPNSLALDLGCGRGRNSNLLAQHKFDVHSIDFVPELVDDLCHQSELLGLTDRIHTYCRSLTEPWLFATQMFDVVIDTFCYKHQVNIEEKEIYRRELARVMKPAGYIYSHLLALMMGTTVRY